MKQPHGWISIALTLAFAGTALGQSTAQSNTRAQPRAQETHETLKDAGAQQAQSAQQTGDDAQVDGDAKAGTWRHLYGVQVDGVRLSALDKEQVEQLQQALQDQGYYTAKVDGVIGRKTRLALRQYYLDQAELASQDLILPQGAASLGLDEADIERVRGEERESEVEEAAIERTRGQDDAPDMKIDMQEVEAQERGAKIEKPIPGPQHANPQPPAR